MKLDEIAAAKKMTKDEAKALAAKTDNAYSFDRYATWSACAAALASMGYTAEEAEAILRSKHMRWAADAASNARVARYGDATSTDLKRYLQTGAGKNVLPGTPGLAALVAEK